MNTHTESLLEKMDLRDLTRGIFAVWGQTEKKVPIMGVYRAFSALVNIRSTLFRDLHFVVYNKQPFSRELERILFDLGTWGVLSIENPRYEYYRVKEAAPKIVIKLLSEEYNVTEEQIKESFKVLVKEFDELVESISRE